MKRIDILTAKSRLHRQTYVDLLMWRDTFITLVFQLHNTRIIWLHRPKVICYLVTTGQNEMLFGHHRSVIFDQLRWQLCECLWFLWKESLNSGRQQFHQYIQNENPLLTLNHFAQESGTTYGAHVNTGQELMWMQHTESCKSYKNSTIFVMDSNVCLFFFNK